MKGYAVRLSTLVETSEGALVTVAAPADPPVRCVIVTDLLDPGRYLEGGELVLTGLAWWRPAKPARSRAFVTALTTAGVAALAAGEAAFGWVPQDLVDACAEAGLPLLRVPVAFSFAGLTERANRQLTGDGDLVAVLARHRELVAAVAAREGTGIGLSTVLDLVAADLGAPCWVLTATGRLVAGTAADPGEPTRREWARANLSGQPVAGFSLIPTAGDRRVAAWFLAIADDDSGWSPSRSAMVAELASLVGLELALSRRRPAPEVGLVTALSADRPSDVDKAVSALGWDAAGPFVVVLGVGPDAGAVLAEAGTIAAWAAVDREVIGCCRTDDPAATVAELRATVAFLGPGLGTEVGSEVGSGALRIGVSDAVSGGEGLLAAVAEARAATRGSEIVAGPELLSSHAHLLAAVPVELRRAYRQRVLGRLLDHDRRHRTDLVRTLAAYLACSGSWSRCAADMHLHVNTVRYRIERVEALTGRDLRRLEDQADLLLALAVSE
jgi:PucR C-terminal helix-turn-helix domain/Purine catabolism regulatory protein-like family